MSTPTIVDFQNLSDEDKKTLQRQAVKNLTKIIAIKVGVAVGIAVVSRVIVKKLEEAEFETPTFTE